MNDYTQQLSIAADPATVHAALSSLAGLRGWWTQDCGGLPEPGGELRFHFGSSYKHMRIDVQTADEIRWHCTVAHIDVPSLQHKDEWVGTELVFRLQPEGDGQTRLDFTHRGLVPACECYDLCRQGWRYFLASLQQYAATGQGTPWNAPGACSHQPQAKESA